MNAERLIDLFRHTDVPERYTIIAHIENEIEMGEISGEWLLLYDIIDNNKKRGSRIFSVEGHAE